MQYVCLNCGYNMVEYFPDTCPFCGAKNSRFLEMDEVITKYQVKETKITDEVSALNSIPALGYEHTCYKIRTDSQIIWIDCPSAYDNSLEKADYILFTHHHFLGASNLYKKQFSSKIYIHRLDADNDLAKRHKFDTKFDDNFQIYGIEAYHIDGHTSGFTMYVFKNCAFICDYMFYKKGKLEFNPYSHQSIERYSKRMKEIMENREKDLEYVCGYDYIEDYKKWKPLFNKLLQD